MKKTYILLLVILAYVLGSLWYRFGTHGTTSTVASTTEQTRSGSGTATSDSYSPSVAIKKDFTYSNFNYGFSMRYPKSVVTEFPFRSYYHLGKDWRAKATSEYRGTPVISFVVYREENETVFPKKYPLYFSTEVRIGISPDTKNCYQRDEGYPNQNIQTVIFNGITWKRFGFAEAGMMQYGQGESYRTIHNKLCYAVEQVKVGSNYRDERMAKGTAESVLSNAYLLAGSVLRTFTFTK
jgi:hypothetical protein